jgi:hypothetical protein
VILESSLRRWIWNSSYWPTSAHYYQIICSEYNRRFDTLIIPRTESRMPEPAEVDSTVCIQRFGQCRGNTVGLIGTRCNGRVRNAPQFSDTPHSAYDLLRDRSPLPSLTIIDAAARELLADGRKWSCWALAPRWRFASSRSILNLVGVRQMAQRVASSRA